MEGVKRFIFLVGNVVSEAQALLFSLVMLNLCQTGYIKM